MSLGVRVGADFLVMGNQEREKAGMENIIQHETDAAIKAAVEAIRILIHQNRAE